VERSSSSRGHPTFDLALTRGRTSLRARVARLRAKSWQVGQCAIAAGLAWYVAKDLIGHDAPFFAPVAAVVSLGTSYGQRLRRVAEVSLGVAIGVFTGDVLTHVLGSGGWQIALIVSLAMVAALLLDASQIFVTQAAVQAIVVSTLLPDPGKAFLRWSDALIGGVVALVAATVVPRAPLRRPREQAAVVVRKISTLLRASATSIEDGDVERSLATLADARSTDALIAELRTAADEGLSVLASSPFRYRHKGNVRQMAELVEPLDFALRNTRVVARRVAVAAYRNEPIPPGYAVFLRDLAEVTDAMAVELSADRMAEIAREPLVALGRASSHLERTSVLSAEVVLASVRSLIADLLGVSGMDPLEATDQIPQFPS
jgi:uncharacterized membrane protein YgaE (UPF0421/DUF939 family)